MLSDSTILKHIARQPKRAAGFKQLVRELGLHGAARGDLDAHLQKLVASGALLAAGSDRYVLPQAAGDKNADKNLVAGRLTMHRDGFGFVIPDANSLSPQFKARLAGDIFIPPHLIGNAMHGDQVLVDVSAIRPDGRAEGRIVRPVARAHPTVVGVFHYGSRGNSVTPIDTKITQEILIPPGMEILNGSVAPPSPAAVAGASRPRGRGKDAGEAPALRKKSVDRVLGEEAAPRAEWDDLEGVVVDVEITDWPTSTQNPRGRVIEILGREDDFGVDVEITIRKFHLPHHFPAATLREAQDAPAIISEHDLRRRRDFRALPIVTIDGETARDFDDAVLVRTLANGNFELQVHIADVAHYVTLGSALDQEARLRGTSVYFPDRAVPMLPLELSTDICSLRPQVERLVLSCVMEIDHRGEIVGYELCEGVIRSAERMTYTAVNAVLEGDAAARGRNGPLVAGFERMRDLAMILHRKRERRGSIDFDLPEAVIEFDEFGMMKSIARSERNMAHRLIEEFMLSANECVAQYLESKRVASLYRIHEKPDAKRVYDFEVIAATFGYSLGVGALPIHRVQLKTDRRAAYGTGKRVREIEVPKEVHITPRMYQKLTEKIAGKPEERILSYLMLRSLKQARYSEENLGHFALAATSYTHFTSPIRRYPDLIVHRILKDVLRESAERHDGATPIGVFPAPSADVRDGRLLKVFIQNEAGSFVKHIHNEKTLALTGTTQVSRAYPFPYGFVLNTTADDGLNVDCFVITETPLRTGEIVECQPIALAEQVEDGQEDHNVVAVIPGEKSRLDQRAQRKISDFVTHVFDNVAGKTIRVGEFLGKEAAVSYLSRHEDNRDPGPNLSQVGRPTDVPSPWSKRRDHAAHREALEPLGGPIMIDELHDIADESSQSERRADDAERELMAWKKVKFMQDRVGDDFDGLITSVTKFGFFVELTDLFVEGLVPLDTLTDDRYVYHENTREIIGQRSRKTYRMGQRIRALVDRIDPVEKKIQFAVLDESRPLPPLSRITQPTRKSKRRRK